MKQTVNRFFAVLAVAFVMMFATTDAYSQCAMCRATVESNVGTGGTEQDNEVGSGLNSGILYLMAVPYVLLGSVGFLWYRYSRKNAKKA
ncbi:hypothetical protein [Pontibacter actiniarum]|uniref:Uncharacterized protein n=1 Tax=Pontibacter actiniarum TaxID=323450 RepID=A0A1X9YMT8_9BACT|nr:hypothetical protein [Pontibacter actiniarum]ARS34198.1 hypothetical protein CA264_01355 [Pontibacter actiniarum]